MKGVSFLSLSVSIFSFYRRKKYSSFTLAICFLLPLSPYSPAFIKISFAWRQRIQSTRLVWGFFRFRRVLDSSVSSGKQKFAFFLLGFFFSTLKLPSLSQSSSIVLKVLSFTQFAHQVFVEIPQRDEGFSFLLWWKWSPSCGFVVFKLREERSESGYLHLPVPYSRKDLLDHCDVGQDSDGSECDRWCWWFF